MMTDSSIAKIAVVIPNWNGKEVIPACIDSLLAQSQTADIIVVENGSTDGSIELLQQQYPNIILLLQPKNLGFAGGVNIGLCYAINNNYDYVALFNNDAVADRDWLKFLVNLLSSKPQVGIVTCKFMKIDKSYLDSTGDTYTTWGLPFPRGRGTTDLNAYDNQTEIFGASGGASLYRTETLKQIGLFDEDFFAYYEDVDISFRAQLAGWRVNYVPASIAYHQIGGTSSKIKGFTTYQSLKNQPWVLYKNVPTKYLWRVWPRFSLAYVLFIGSALSRGQIWPVAKGVATSLFLAPKKLIQRYSIQSNRKVTPDYIWQIMVHDLPPNAKNLRHLRTFWYKITGKKYV